MCYNENHKKLKNLIKKIFLVRITNWNSFVWSWNH